jgi:hypothetical protein
MVKAFPLQMPAPYLTRLLEPFGNFSPMGVLWTSIAASPAYERFAGCAELAAAVCLFIPRLSLVGAVIMRLSARRIMTVAQIVFGACLIAMNVVSARQRWYDGGGGAPRSALYGIWDVETMTIDGVERPPLVNDDDRWRRVIVQNANAIVFQRMDSTFLFFPSKTDSNAKTIVLTSPSEPKLNARFSFDRPDPTHMSLAGEIDGRKIRMALHLFDHSKLLLLSRGFNWIQEYPFNR